MKVQYPYYLLFFPQEFLADVQKPLIKIGNNSILIDNFIDLVYLYGTYSINYHQVPILIFAANTVLIDFFKLENLIFREIVLLIELLLLHISCEIDRKSIFL